MMKMKAIVRASLYWSLCLVFIASCGGDPEVVDPPIDGPVDPVGPDPVDPKPFASACSDLLEEGRKIYEGSGNCLLCHGSDGISGSNKPIDLTAESYRHSTMKIGDPSLSMVDYIAEYMPQGGSCKGACADSVTVYVRSLGDQAWCPEQPSEVVDKIVAMQPLHRLSTTQHQRVIKSIIGVDYDVSSQLPKDSAVGGFDNAAEGLTLPRDNVSLYLAIADEVVAKALPGPNGVNSELNPAGCNASNETCARNIVRRLASRAFRRGANEQYVDRYLTLFDQIRSGGNFVALKDTIKAILISPRFLFTATTTADIQSTLLDPYLIANRLSFFLWSSSPDQELLDLAASGTLLENNIMAQQVARMMRDQKAEGFIEGFVGHWLALNRLRSAADTLQEYPLYNKDVKDALIEEIELFVREFMLNDIALNKLIDPPFGHLNNVLAKHYGLPVPNSETMVKVDKGPGQRRGVFHLGGWHLAESDGAETNPIRRGAWVLDQLLCTPMGSPPADAAATLPDSEGENLSIRELLEKHRTDPTCANCHDFIDPAGLGFEFFNAIGAPDLSQQSDGKFPGGVEFTNPMELPDLMSGSRQVSDCLTRKLYSYAHARQLTDADALFITDILDNLSGQESFAQVVNAIVLSPSFRQSPTLAVLNAGPADNIDEPPEPVNKDIKVTFSLPSSKTVSLGYDPLPVRADVTHEKNGVTIASVELFIDGKSVRTETKAPYDWGHITAGGVDFTDETTGLASGIHEFKVLVTDSENKTGTGRFLLTVEGGAQ